MAIPKRYLTQSFAAWHAFTPRKGDKVVIGMSGGVDSSVTACLLAEEDYDLSAVFMRNWDTRDESGTDEGCEWKKDWEDVQRVCGGLDIPCRLIDLSREYWNRVFEPSLCQWEMGVTPNPDVWCNREIKFGALLERLSSNGYAHQKPWFATGHYARKDWTGCYGKYYPRLLRAADRNKDQSYYLSAISEDGLKRALFPLGHLNKPEVRQLAKKYQLPNADRPESMGICFVGEKTQFGKFLSSYLPTRSGPIYELSTNRRIGVHTGLWNYTIGENARIPGMPTRMFVAKKDANHNAIYVAPGTDNSALYCSAMQVTRHRWIMADKAPEELFSPSGFRARVMYRYRMQDVPCTVYTRQGDESNLFVKFDEPQKAVSPGQVAALYHGDWCLGCGTILETFSNLPSEDYSPLPLRT